MKRIVLSSLLIASLLAAFTCGPGTPVVVTKSGSASSCHSLETQPTADISSTNGIKLAADEVNSTGGINGKQIELLVQDDRSDASEAATIVTKFVTQDQVHAILGEVASSRSIAAAPIAQNAKIPMLTPSSTNPEVTKKGDCIFAVVSLILCKARPSPSLGRRRSELPSAGHRWLTARMTLLGGARESYPGGFCRAGAGCDHAVLYRAGDQVSNAQIASIEGATPDDDFADPRLLWRRRSTFAKQARDKGDYDGAAFVGGDGRTSPVSTRSAATPPSTAATSATTIPDDERRAKCARNLSATTRPVTAQFTDALGSALAHRDAARGSCLISRSPAEPILARMESAIREALAATKGVSRRNRYSHP